MSDQHTYLIQLCGSTDIDEVNALAPLLMQAVRSEATTMQVTVSADQAGLIGLLRHLHGLGFQFLSVICESTHQENKNVENETDTDYR
jgi:hypothetical protein